MSTRLAIGDFSRMTHLSIKALRRYHDLGLLVPADVDLSSGYRYYEASQVPVGQVIRRFRDLGMPLDQVREVLDASDPGSRNAVIVAHLRQLESALQQTQQSVSSLRALLEQPPKPIAVEYRSIGDDRALALRERVEWDDGPKWWMAAFKELHLVLGAIGAQRTGPDGALYPSEFFEDHVGEVTAFVPIDDAPEEPQGRVQLAEIPGAEYAITVHMGPFGELDQAYGALGTIVAEREIGVQGPVRENYIVSFEHTHDESAHRTEVCWPVFHTRGDT